ncbi:MAG TPA: YqzL family protein [Chondromyces sp.]|nr:YqzL family protein [Chondromyces sp.]
MLNFTWKIFSETGSIDTYLLYKELEKDHQESSPFAQEDELAELDFPVS